MSKGETPKSKQSTDTQVVKLVIERDEDIIQLTGILAFNGYRVWTEKIMDDGYITLTTFLEIDAKV